MRMGMLLNNNAKLDEIKYSYKKAGLDESGFRIKMFNSRIDELSD